jgi:hypothetical protein
MRLRLLPIALCLAAAGAADRPMPGSGATALDAAVSEDVPASVVPSVSNRADANLPIVLDVWKHRVEMNRGVHAWTRRHDGMRVWQEWIALLTLARSASPEARRQTGLALQKYVVDGNIRPNGFIGTSLPVPGYEDGDFDMSLLGCASLLGLFAGDRDLLTDATMVHLLKNVMRIWGQTPKAYFDVVFVSVPETENHLFMTESSRYIANQLIWENPRRLPQLDALRDSLTRRGVVIDNRQGNLKRLLLKLMQQAMCKGFFEFNAQIYQRFTVHALDNLYTFARDEAIRDGAGCLLDYLSAVFAFQSYDGIRYGPFRRSSEVYEDSSLIGNDAVCSFFGIQSGSLADNAAGRKGLWRLYSTHSSMALFSAVLGYRIPDPILWYMQHRQVEYRAEIRSAYAGNGSRKRPTEVYAGSGNFLLTAGGRYESYAGPNFPTAGFWFDKAPWVYDVITRPGSLILDPRKDRPEELKDILHFRGPQWRANNLAIHRTFLYGYALSEAYNSPEWPQHVPAGWKWDGSTYSTRDFDFRFLDRSDAGVYVVLSRLRPVKTYLNWSYQKYLRGGIEVVEASRAGSLDALREKTLANNSAKAHWPLGPRRFTYVDFSGAAIHLNSRYDGNTDGITRIEEPPAAPEAGSEPAIALPFSYPWMGGRQDGGPAAVLAGFLGGGEPEPPLFQADLFAPWKGRAALSDGQGNMYVFNPATGGYCLANFREWWNPRRKIHGPLPPR